MGAFQDPTSFEVEVRQAQAISWCEADCHSCGKREACATETASISTRYGDMTDASIALLKNKGVVFSGAEMGPHCAFRLRAPFFGQQ